MPADTTHDEILLVDVQLGLEEQRHRAGSFALLASIAATAGATLAAGSLGDTNDWFWLRIVVLAGTMSAVLLAAATIIWSRGFDVDPARAAAAAVVHDLTPAALVAYLVDEKLTAYVANEARLAVAARLLIGTVLVAAVDAVGAGLLLLAGDRTMTP